MSDRIAVMSNAELQQLAPRDISGRPSNRFVADFIGDTNLLAVEVTAVNGAVAQCQIEGKLAVTAQMTEGVDVKHRLHVSIRPERISLVTKMIWGGIFGHSAGQYFHRHGHYEPYLFGERHRRRVRVQFRQAIGAFSRPA